MASAYPSCIVYLHTFFICTTAHHWARLLCLLLSTTWVVTTAFILSLRVGCSEVLYRLNRLSYAKRRGQHALHNCNTSDDRSSQYFIG